MSLSRNLHTYIQQHKNCKKQWNFHNRHTFWRLITACKRNWGKVMFLHLCVILSFLFSIKSLKRILHVIIAKFWINFHHFISSSFHLSDRFASSCVQTHLLSVDYYSKTRSELFYLKLGCYFILWIFLENTCSVYSMRSSHQCRLIKKGC